MTFPPLSSIFIIAIPLLLEILFFWNNDDFGLGLKSMEKSVSLFLFPMFIIGNKKYLQAEILTKVYGVIMTLVMTIFFIRYYFVYNQFFLSFYYGMNMWNMGYHFAGTMGLHAPALNMHLAFGSMCNLYFLIATFRTSNSLLLRILMLLNFLISFIFILIINTRIALAVSLLCYLIIFLHQILIKQHRLNLKKMGIITILITVVLIVFISNNQFMKEKYNRMIFDKIEMVGKLDQIERPEFEVYSSLVTRLTIWKTTIDLAKNNLVFGVGSSDGKKELFRYYEKTNQQFLARHQLPVHNQYLDFLLKFGILGLLGILVYMGYIGYIGFKAKNILTISFFLLFCIANITDDFLIRFDGIVFSGFWISVFTAQGNQIKL